MYYLLFICDCRESEIRRLFKQIIVNNNALEITSNLYFTETNYIQYMEGEQKTIQNLYDIIKSFQHNRNVQLIADGEVLERFSEGPCMYKFISNKQLIKLGYNDLKDYSSKRMFTDVEKYFYELEAIRDKMKL